MWVATLSHSSLANLQSRPRELLMRSTPRAQCAAGGCRIKLPMSAPAPLLTSKHYRIMDSVSCVTVSNVVTVFEFASNAR
jgi:hypothetical protein